MNESYPLDFCQLFLVSEHHTTRLEGLEEARERDTKAAEAWIGKFWK